jgi:hypothetical protein
MFSFKVKNLIHRARGIKAELYRKFGVGVLSEVSAILIRADGTRVDYGVLSRRLVTNAGVAFLVDAFQNLVEIENMNWHASGTGVAAEDVANTTLGTETGSRVSGTQSEPAANQYRTVATVPYSGTLAITEHGLFSANAAGTLWDRSVFTAINVVNGDSIQFTYTLTVNSGG